MRWTTLFSLSLLAAAGCETKPAGTEASGVAASTQAKGSASQKSAAAPKLCDKADALAARLSGIDAKASRVSLGADVALPESKDGTPVSLISPVVVVTPKELRANGKTVKGPADLAGALGSQSKVLLAIPRGEEGIGRLGEIVAGLGKGTEITLLASLPGAKGEPAPKGIDIGTKDASERARILAEALSKAIASCPQASKIFQELSSDEPSGRAEAIKNRLPGAINACSCKVGDDAADLVAYVLGGDAPVIGKRLVLSKDAAAKGISLKGLDGQKLYDALPSDGSPVRLDK